MKRNIINSIICAIIVIVTIILAFMTFDATQKKKAKAESLQQQILAEENQQKDNVVTPVQEKKEIQEEQAKKLEQEKEAAKEKKEQAEKNKEKAKSSTEVTGSLNNFSVPDNVTKVRYGTSGEGRGLYYYKIGHGKKLLLLNFAIHGYEDGWAKDGYQLVNMAKYIISHLSEKEDEDDGLNGWTVYVIPTSNPDGLVDGYTNNGPGRCQVSKGIDVNRDFPGNFIHYNNSRNKTGSKPLQSPEARALAGLVNRLLDISPDLVVVDTHGWLDTTYGNARVASYFDKQFYLDNKPVKNYEGGYFAGYAREKGAREVLVELPPPANPQDMKNRKYNERMFKAVDNLIDNYQF